MVAPPVCAGKGADGASVDFPGEGDRIPRGRTGGLPRRNAVHRRNRIRPVAVHLVVCVRRAEGGFLERPILHHSIVTDRVGA